MPAITVSKLDAATRQLRTAIQLWFADGDPVSIQTLLGAAHEIIHTLYRRKGLQNLLFDSDIIKDEYRGEWAKKLKSVPNFFKHAREDPDGVMDFNTEGNMYLIFFLLTAIHRMGAPMAPRQPPRSDQGGQKPAANRSANPTPAPGQAKVLAGLPR